MSLANYGEMKALSWRGSKSAPTLIFITSSLYWLSYSASEYSDWINSLSLLHQPKLAVLIIYEC